MSFCALHLDKKQNFDLLENYWKLLDTKIGVFLSAFQFFFCLENANLLLNHMIFCRFNGILVYSEPFSVESI